MEKLAFVLLFVLVGYANAAELSIDAVPAQSMGLGTHQDITLTIHGEGPVDLAVDPESLDAQDAVHDVTFSILPRHLVLERGIAQVTLTITTKTSAPSFTGGTVRVTAQSRDSNTEATFGFSIKPLYVIHILQKREGSCEDNAHVTDNNWICDFDSPTGTSYFRAHAAGLKIVFQNETHEALEIHGQDAILHGTGTFGPGQTDPLERTIAPAPADLKGSYTLHGIYRPGRDAVFNASRIPD